MITPPPPEKPSRPHNQKKDSPRKATALDANYEAAMKEAGQKRRLKVVSNIYVAMKLAWKHARTNYQNYISEFNINPGKETMRKVKRMATCDQTASKGWVN